MTERLSIMAAARLASERQHTRSFTIRRGDVIMLRDSISTRCSGVATTPRYGIGIMRYTSTVTIGHAPAGTALHTPAVTTRYTSTVTIGHTPAVTTLRGSDITTLRGFAAGMVLTAPGGASHLSEMLRLLPASERLNARSAINTILAQRSVVISKKQKICKQ